MLASSADGCDVCEDFGTFFVGIGDVASFGATKWVRNQPWYGDSYVDYGSGWYTSGQVTGFGLSMATGAAIGKAGAAGAAKGLEFSHWIPARWGGARSLWNGKYVTATQHALMDPFRYKFMPAAWKAVNPMPNFLVQMWNRLPAWTYGLMGGTAYGTGSLLNQ
jgi:hypothetical protein